MNETQMNPGKQFSWPDQASPVDPALASRLREDLGQLLRQETLHDDGLIERFESLYLPMVRWIAERHGATPLLLGINGGQGSGKSTLSKILRLLLSRGFNKRVAVISIDDLYLPRNERLRLASRVHPLLATRGVPGTHDIPLAMQVLGRLKRGGKEAIDIPVFDKAMDDRATVDRWQNVQGPVDIILFEGWCVGCAAQAERDLEKSVNSLESMEDRNCQWRRYVNRQLAGPYHDLFALIDVLIMLKIPDMKYVYDWRLLQEDKLRQALAGRPGAATHVMTEKELKRFIMHYERITRFSLKEMPRRADVVLELNAQHQVDGVFLKAPE